MVKAQDSAVTPFKATVVRVEDGRVSVAVDNEPRECAVLGHFRPQLGDPVWVQPTQDLRRPYLILGTDNEAMPVRPLRMTLSDASITIKAHPILSDDEREGLKREIGEAILRAMTDSLKSAEAS